MAKQRRKLKTSPIRAPMQLAEDRRHGPSVVAFIQAERVESDIAFEPIPVGVQRVGLRVAMHQHVGTYHV